MAPVVLVMKEISPKIRLVPMLMMMATPTLIINSTASNQEVVVNNRMQNISGMMMDIMCWISTSVVICALTVSTGLPLMAPSSPMIARMASKVCSWFSSATVTEKRALPSL